MEEYAVLGRTGNSLGSVSKTGRRLRPERLASTSSGRVLNTRLRKSASVLRTRVAWSEATSSPAWIPEQALCALPGMPRPASL